MNPSIIVFGLLSQAAASRSPYFAKIMTVLRCAHHAQKLGVTRRKTMARTRKLETAVAPNIT